MELTPPEQRVLGALAEKELTTPDTYPLTTNALVAACNQASNRDPVTDYDESTVLAAVAVLRDRDLVRSVKRAGDRVMKHRHDLDKTLHLGPAERAVLGVLLLRGAQTPGELRARTDRYEGVEAPDAVDRALTTLAAADPPLARRLERRPGQKEARWAHLLGPVHEQTISEGVVSSAPSGPPTSQRLDDLEATIETLSARLASVEASLDELRRELGA